MAFNMKKRYINLFTLFRKAGTGKGGFVYILQPDANDNKARKLNRKKAEPKQRNQEDCPQEFSFCSIPFTISYYRSYPSCSIPKRGAEAANWAWIYAF